MIRTTHSDKKRQNAELINLSDAARQLRIDQDTLKTWAETGFIHEYTVRSDTYFKTKDILALQGRLMG